MNKYKALIFDLDGTLIETLKGITDAVNLTFEQCGINIKRDYNEAKAFIGAGADEFLRRACKGMEIDEKLGRKLGEAFIKNYDAIQNEASTPFPGMNKLLINLKKNGYILTIASNKPHVLLQHIIKDKFPEVKFDAVLGQRDGIPHKPDPYVINEIRNMFALDKKDCLYIGDSEYDYLTAKNAEIDCLIVKYGYGFYDQDFVKKSRFAVDSVEDIAKILIK